MHRSQRGFTMVELMTTVIILATITALAFPSLRGFIQRSNAASAANTMLTSLALARSEAVRGNSRVTVCGSESGTACDGRWDSGWIVFLDNAQPRQFDTGQDTVVQVFPPLAKEAVMTQSVDMVSFLGNGGRDITTVTTQGRCFELIVADNEEARRYVRISNNGAMRTGKGVCS